MSTDREAKRGTGLDVTVRDRTDSAPKRPRMFKVVVLNDDFTPMDWVISLLVNVFRKSLVDARLLTQEIHEKGAAVVGIYTHEIAETKCAQVLHHAARDSHPLIATMEAE
jgi:ATP-dependent Clp protease adaptor protein ClpS